MIKICWQQSKDETYALARKIEHLEISTRFWIQNIYEYFVINRNCRCLFTNIFYFLKIHICRKMLGEGLDASSIEELQQLENQLDRSLMKIRAKKVTYIYIYDVIIIYLLFHRDLRLWRGGLVRFLFIKRKFYYHKWADYVNNKHTHTWRHACSMHMWWEKDLICYLLWVFCFFEDIFYESSYLLVFTKTYLAILFLNFSINYYAKKLRS